MPASPLEITSLDDPRVELYRNVRDRDLQGRDHVFVAESELVIRRLLQARRRMHSLLLTRGKYEALREDVARVPESVPVYVAGLELMCAIAGFHVHRGALAVVHRPTPAALSLDVVLQTLPPTGTSRLLVVEGITNVDNIGGLFRVAAAFGFDAVVLDPTSSDPLYRKAVRVSMGHVLSVPYAVSTEWPGDLDRIRQEYGMTLIGAESCADAVPLWSLPRVQRPAILVGSEAHGLSIGALRHCDHVAVIPMYGDVPSINVVSAAAVCAYESHRPSE